MDTLADIGNIMTTPASSILSEQTGRAALVMHKQTVMTGFGHEHALVHVTATFHQTVSLASICKEML